MECLKEGTVMEQFPINLFLRNKFCLVEKGIIQSTIASNVLNRSLVNFVRIVLADIE